MAACSQIQTLIRCISHKDYKLAKQAMLQCGQHGEDLDTVDGDGCTALWWAVRVGAVDITRSLLENGAQP